MNPIIPVSRSRSISKTFWFRRPSSAATWQTIVVAPQPPLAERNAKLFPAPFVLPSRRLLRSAERFSKVFRSGSLRGGNRYSLMPARRDERKQVFVDARAQG